MTSTQKPGVQKKNKAKKQEDPEEIIPVDLTFCYQLEVILDEQLNKLSYIGQYTSSNSKGAMSKIIGLQIQDKLTKQRELENIFENLIIEKSQMIDLVDEEKINKKNEEIKTKAEELKSSAYSIYKTLAENPDVPKNLAKAKTDQAKLINDIEKIKSDLVNGNFDNYDKIIQKINRGRFNIDELRRTEMTLYKELKTLNTNYANEEKDFKKDKMDNELNLLADKKKLANTKLEENMFEQYQMAQIDALYNLHKSNFLGEEEKLKSEIIAINAQKEKNMNLNEYFRGHMRKQMDAFIQKTNEWRKKTNISEKERDLKNDELKKFIDKQKDEIENLKNKISVYRAANEGLENDAVALKSIPYDLIHNPKAKAEKERKEKEEKERKEREAKEAAEAAAAAANPENAEKK